MSSQTKTEKPDQKREWVTPRLDRLDTRDAESSHGNVPDGGGGFQGS